VRLLLVEPQPHERVRRRRERLDCPRSLAGHRDQLLARVGARPDHAQELRRPCAGRDPERDQGPVPVGHEPGEQLVEHRVRDLLRNPLGDLRPVQAGLLLRERVQRVVVRMRPSRPGQRERVHDRPGPRVQVIRVKPAADRLAVRRRRRREPRRRRPFPRHRPGSGRPPGLAGQLEPAAEVPCFHPRRLAPGDLDSPGEPEPAKQRQRVRPLRRRRPTRRLQVPQELRHRLDPAARRITQVVRLPPVPGLHEAPGRGHHQRPEIPDRTIVVTFSHEPRP
jgi:hypothetical protein